MKIDPYADLGDEVTTPENDKFCKFYEVSRDAFQEFLARHSNWENYHKATPDYSVKPTPDCIVFTYYDLDTGRVIGKWYTMYAMNRPDRYYINADYGVHE